MVRNNGSRPPIGVSWVSPGQEKSERYLRAVTAAGGEAVPLLAGAESWDTELSGIRGLLLTGGGDMDPWRYGQDNEGLSRIIIAERDELELKALHHCLERRLPVLGICRGIQVINVALGGSLLQDIDTGIEHRASKDISSLHALRVLPGSQLSAIIGREGQIEVNSRHHQGFLEEQVAAGLRVNALAPDGIVEGIEMEGEPFLVAVQCHPERTQEAPDLGELFHALVSHARLA